MLSPLGYLKLHPGLKHPTKDASPPASSATFSPTAPLSPLAGTLTRKWGAPPQPSDGHSSRSKAHRRNTMHGPRNTSHDSPATALPIPAITSAIMRRKLKTNYL